MSTGGRKAWKNCSADDFPERLNILQNRHLITRAGKHINQAGRGNTRRLEWIKSQKEQTFIITFLWIGSRRVSTAGPQGAQPSTELGIRCELRGVAFACLLLLLSIYTITYSVQMTALQTYFLYIISRLFKYTLIYADIHFRSVNWTQ